MQEILDALRRYHGDNGGPLEIRLFGPFGARPTLCPDLKTAAKVAHAAEREGGWAVCHLPQLIRPDYEQQGWHGVTDADVIRRQWFLFDVDVVKPKGVTAATDEQRAAALELAQNVLEQFVAAGADRRGIILTDSGNGYHVDVRTDAPADEESRDVALSVLSRIKKPAEKKWPGLVVDTRVHNAGRLWRLPGTTNHKSGRRCQILSGREDAREFVTPWRVFVDLAKVPPAAATKRREPVTDAPPVPLDPSPDVVAALAALGVGITERKRQPDGAALFELDRCPLPGGDRHDVNQGTFVVVAPGRPPYVYCHHAKCQTDNAGKSGMRLDRVVPAVTGKAADGRPVVDLSLDNRTAAESAVADALAGDVYRRLDGTPILVSRREEQGTDTDPGAFKFRELSPVVLQRRAAAACQFWRPRSDGRPPVRADLPLTWCDAMIQEGHGLTQWRTVRGVSGLPLFDLASGAMTTRPGYHAGSRLWLDTAWVGDGLPEPSDTAEAVARICRPFESWIDEGDVAKGPVVAAVLSAVLRPSLDTSPMLGVTARAVGTGKTWLAETLGVIGTGAYPYRFAAGSNDDELDKRINTALLSGSPVVLMDNVKRPLDVDTLEAALTGQVQVRRFGTQDGEESHAAQFWIATFNQPSLSVDLARRVFRLDLESSSECPAEREFTGPTPQVVAAENRAEIVGAAAWLIRRQIEHGGTYTRAGSFTEWARIVDGACQAACKFSPAKGLLDAVKSDPDAELLRTLVRGSVRNNMPAEFSVRDTLAWDPELMGGEVMADAWLSVVQDDGTGSPDMRDAGAWLARQGGKVVVAAGARWRLVRRDRKSGCNWYQFEAVKP